MNHFILDQLKYLSRVTHRPISAFKTIPCYTLMSFLYFFTLVRVLRVLLYVSKADVRVISRNTALVLPYCLIPENWFSQSHCAAVI